MAPDTDGEVQIGVTFDRLGRWYIRAEQAAALFLAG
jgi:hypothetical protein